MKQCHGLRPGSVANLFSGRLLAVEKTPPLHLRCTYFVQTYLFCGGKIKDNHTAPLERKTFNHKANLFGERGQRVRGAWERAVCRTQKKRFIVHSEGFSEQRRNLCSKKQKNSFARRRVQKAVLVPRGTAVFVRARLRVRARLCVRACDVSLVSRVDRSRAGRLSNAIIQKLFQAAPPATTGVCADRTARMKRRRRR